MKNYINKIEITGTIHNEAIYSEAKTPFLKFTVMTKHQILKNDGTIGYPAVFHPVVVFGDEAKKLKDSIKVGAWVQVTGLFSQRKYNENYYNQIIADSITAITPAKKPTTKKRAAA